MPVLFSARNTNLDQLFRSIFITGPLPTHWTIHFLKADVTHQMPMHLIGATYADALMLMYLCWCTDVDVLMLIHWWWWLWVWTWFVVSVVFVVGVVSEVDQDQDQLADLSSSFWSGLFIDPNYIPATLRKTNISQSILVNNRQWFPFPALSPIHQRAQSEHVQISWVEPTETRSN